MIITKQQSKRLRYICGAAEYNQPCVREYTQTPEGKLRKIGKFEYLEGDSELKSLKCNGNIIKLDEYSPESLMASLPELAADTTASPENLPDTDTPKQEIYVPPMAEVHPVNITATAYSDEGGWMDENGNDPETVNPGMADVPERLDPAEDPPETPETEPPADTKTAAFVISEDDLRELSMTVSAMEASRLCNVASGDLGDTSVEIIRRNATVPNFLTIYGECLKKAGNPRSLEELAAAFPHFQDWILTGSSRYPVAAG